MIDETIAEASRLTDIAPQLLRYIKANQKLSAVVKGTELPL